MKIDRIKQQREDDHIFANSLYQLFREKDSIQQRMIIDIEAVKKSCQKDIEAFKNKYPNVNLA